LILRFLFLIILFHEDRYRENRNYVKVKDSVESWDESSVHRGDEYNRLGIDKTIIYNNKKLKGD
jgi:hypothetical protein